MSENMTDSTPQNIIQVGDWVRVKSGPDTIPYQWGMVGTVDAISEQDSAVVIRVHNQPLQMVPIHAVTHFDITTAKAIRR